MNQREKILLYVVLVIFVGLGARSIHGRLERTYQQYANQQKPAERELTKTEFKFKRVELAAERRHQYRARSLPSDREIAEAAYQSWVLQALEDAGIRNVSPKELQAVSRDAYTELNYQFTGDADLSAIIKFLYAFYSADFLHQIDQFDFGPQDGGKSFRPTINVAALVLADADEEIALNEKPSKRLALTDAKAYQDAIISRNIFAVYTPPRPAVVKVDRPPRENTSPPEPKFDHAEHAFVTAIVESGDLPEVWIIVRTTGKRHHLQVGDTFEVGDLKGRIVSINHRDFVFETDGKQYVVKTGRNLRQGQEVTAS